ncbi:hypothetical protein PIN31115_02592 [Pandoraea iniqua]|uniref:Uncharacterized protein n=1 Tax=Pandoraea iniqua TaxID=2508288 RepID=A0A5E4VDY4_9BURK|nr:hypothetical protein PIN31115_02592 [Pandoraea iniqua]
MAFVFPFVPRNHVAGTAAKCSQCCHLLPVDAFYTRDDRPVWTRGHWSSKCKDCMRVNAVAKYRSDPEAATSAKRRLRAKRRPCELWRKHMDPVYRNGMDEAANARRDRKLARSFHHSLMLHQNPYPKGYPHSYSAKAANRRFKREGQAAMSTAVTEDTRVALWARDNLSPADALAALRAMHKTQRGPK